MYKILFVFLCLAMIFAISMPAFIQDIDSSVDDVEFHYPLTPEMDEWKSLRSLDEIIDACQIPSDILSRLSTESLIDIVLDYPLAINIFAYDTPEEGINKLSSYFNGLQELESRSDAVELLSNRLTQLTQESSADTVKTIFAESALGLLSGNTR